MAIALDGAGRPKGRSEDAPLLLRAEEVARLLGIGRSTVFQMLAEGELPTVRFGRATRVPRQAVLDLVAARQADGRYR